MDSGGTQRDIRQYLFPVLVTTAVLVLPALSGRFGWLQTLVPLPFFYFLTIQDAEQGKKTMAGAAVASFLIGLATGTLQVLFYSYLLAPLGVLIAHGNRRRETLTAIAIKATVLLTALWLVLGIFYASVNQSNPYTDILAGVDAELVKTHETIQKQYGELPFDTKKELQLALDQVRKLVPKIMPALIAVMIIMTVWLNLAIGQYLLNRKAYLPSWGNLRDWRLPDWLIWGAITAGFLVLMPGEKMQLAGTNLLVVFTTLYFFQGLAVIATKLEKWSTPPFMRLMIYTMLLFLQIYALALIVVFGVTDIWLEKRTENEKQKAT